MLGLGKVRHAAVRTCTHRPIPLCTYHCTVDAKGLNPFMKQYLFMKQQKEEMAQLKKEKRRAEKDPVRNIKWLPKYSDYEEEPQPKGHQDPRPAWRNFGASGSRDSERGPDGVPYDWRKRLAWIGTEEFDRVSPEMYTMMKKYQREMDELLSRLPKNDEGRLKSNLEHDKISALDKINPGLAEYLRSIMDNGMLHNLNYYPRDEEELYDPEAQVRTLDEFMQFRDIAGLLDILKNGGTLNTAQLAQLLRFLAALCQMSPENIRQYLDMLRSYGVLTPDILKYMKDLLKKAGVDIPMEKLNRLFKEIDAKTKQMLKAEAQRKYGGNGAPWDSQMNGFGNGGGATQLGNGYGGGNSQGHGPGQGGFGGGNGGANSQGYGPGQGGYDGGYGGANSQGHGPGQGGYGGGYGGANSRSPNGQGGNGGDFDNMGNGGGDTGYLNQQAGGTGAGGGQNRMAGRTGPKSQAGGAGGGGMNAAGQRYKGADDYDSMGLGKGRSKQNLDNLDGEGQGGSGKKGLKRTLLWTPNGNEDGYPDSAEVAEPRGGRRKSKRGSKRISETFGYLQPWRYEGDRSDIKQTYRKSMATNLRNLLKASQSNFTLTQREAQKMREIEAIQTVFPLNFFDAKLYEYEVPVLSEEMLDPSQGFKRKSVAPPDNLRRKSHVAMPQTKYVPDTYQETYAKTSLSPKVPPMRASIFQMERQKPLPSFLYK